MNYYSHHMGDFKVTDKISKLRGEWFSFNDNLQGELISFFEETNKHIRGVHHALLQA